MQHEVWLAVCVLIYYEMYFSLFILYERCSLYVYAKVFFMLLRFGAKRKYTSECFSGFPAGIYWELTWLFETFETFQISLDLMAQILIPESFLGLFVKLRKRKTFLVCIGKRSFSAICTTQLAILTAATTHSFQFIP